MVDIPSAYGLNTVKAVVLTYHLNIKYSTERGEWEVRGYQHVARKCYVSAFKWKEKAKETPLIEPLKTEGRRPERKAELVDELERIPLGDDLTKRVQMGTSPQLDVRVESIDFIRANADVFAGSLQTCRASIDFKPSTS